MPILSVILQDALWVVIAIAVSSFIAKRFTWKNYWVYAVIFAGFVEVVIVLVTGSYLLGHLAWLAVVIASLFPSVRLRVETLLSKSGHNW